MSIPFDPSRHRVYLPSSSGYADPSGITISENDLFASTDAAAGEPDWENNYSAGRAFEIARGERDPEFDPGRYALPAPDVIRENLRTLADKLEYLARVLGVTRVQINSGFRPPGHNNSVGGADSSRHMAGLAADVVMIGTNALDGSYEKIPIEKIAQKGAELELFEHCIYYPSRGFTHLALPRSGTTPNYEWWERGSSRKNSAGTGQAVPRADSGDFDYSTEDRDVSGREIDENEIIEAAPFTSLSESTREALGDTGPEGEREADSPPNRGEIDIGDIRIGRGMRARSDASLSQPTATGRQSTAAVQGVEVLRSSQEGQVAGQVGAPEITISISINSSDRDDVNEVLRPLMAMMRRYPFLPVRGDELAEELLGLSPGGDLLAQLREARVPDPESLADEIEEGGLRRLWVPARAQSFTVESAPSASGLFYAHLSLTTANVVPYVGQLSFWKRTEDALEWAKYLQERNETGAEPTEVEEDGSARQRLFGGGQSWTNVPAAVGQGETDNPRESHVFRKFYRGLLKEGEGYPASDEDRRWERYTEGDVLIEYDRPLGESRASLLSGLFEDLRTEQRRVEAISAAGRIVNQTGGPTGFQDLGRRSAFEIGLSKEWGIFSRLGSLSSRLASKVKARIQSEASARRHQLPAFLRRSGKSGDAIEYMESQSEDTDQYAPGSTAAMADAQAPLMTESPVADLIVSLPEAIQSEQDAILKTYASLLHELETNHSSKYTKFVNREKEKCVGMGGVFEAEGGLSGTNSLGHREFAEPSDREAFAVAVFSPEYLKRLVEDARLDGLGPTGKIQDLLEATETLTQIVQDTLTKKEYDLENEIKRYYTDVARHSQRGGIRFGRGSVVEKVRFRRRHRFSEEKWSSFSKPVPQHVGSSGMEITYEVSTNDPLILAQLSELREAQQQEAEKAEGGLSPAPRVTMSGEGSLPRALGAREMVYRGHTTESDDRPGWRRVTLRLVQDEATWSRKEKFTKVSGGPFENAVLGAPLAMPRLGDRAAEAQDVLGRMYERNMQNPAPLPNSPGGLSHPDRNFPGIQEAFEERGRVTQVEASYDFASNQFKTRFQYQNAPSRNVNLSEYLKPFENFLEEAKGKMSPQAWKRLADRIASVLDGGRGGRGWILTLHDMALAVWGAKNFENQNAFVRFVEGYAEGVAAGSANLRMDGVPAGAANQLGVIAGLVGAIRQTVSGNQELVLRTDLVSGPQFRHRPQKNETGPTNLTKLAYELFDSELGEDTRPELVHLMQGFLSVGQEMARLMIAWPEAVRAYRAYLAEEDSGLFFHSDARKAISDLEKTRAEAEEVVPTCQPDVLLKDVKDQRGRSLVGWDFPFGPGPKGLSGDAALSSYRQADQMRRYTQIQRAATGMGMIEEFVPSSRNGTPDQAEVDGFDQIWKRAAEDVGGASEFFETRGVENSLGGALSLASEYNLFSAPGEIGRLSRGDLATIIRLAQTARYVSKVTAVATEGITDELGSVDSGELRRRVENTLTNLDSFSIAESSISVSDALNFSSTSKKVQSDYSLAKEREKLAKLYSADDAAITNAFGYADPTQEPRRAQRIRQLQKQWKGPVGMRRAFPSYQILILDRESRGGFEMLGDVYSWGAASEINIRKGTKEASQTATLRLSNLRNQLSDGGGYGQAAKLEEGTRMWIGLGYGPDRSGLEPFVGRVTTANLMGPTASVEVSSYSTTLANPPNDGKGFVANGAKESFSYQQALFMNIASTSGLEGLGRRDYRGGQDPLGRRDPETESSIKASMLLTAHRRLGSFGASKLLGDASGDYKRLSGLVEKVAGDSISDAQEIFMGAPALYENVWLARGNTDQSRWDILTLGFDELLSGGSGFQWMSFPGDSLWTQLQKMAKLKPGWVVGVRPYNSAAPLDALSRHAPRQTLYFGPKQGHYAPSSEPVGDGSSFDDEVQRSVKDVLADVWVGDQNLSPREKERLRGTEYYRQNWENLYTDIFYEGFLRRNLLETIQTASEPGDTELLDPVREWISSGLDLIGAETQQALADFVLTGQTFERLESRTRSTFGTIRRDENLKNPLIAGSGRNALKYLLQHAPPSKLRESALAGPGETVSIGGGGSVEDEFERHRQFFYENTLEDFKRALPRLARQAEFYENLSSQELTENPVIQRLREEFEDQGFDVDAEFRPFQSQHFASGFDTLIRQEIEATSEDNRFANRILLEWPEDGDPLAAYDNETGDTKSWALSANPTILSNAIKEKHVFFENLDDDLSEVASLRRAQMEEGFDGGLDRFDTLVQKRSEFRDKSGQNVEWRGQTMKAEEALEEITTEIEEGLAAIGDAYVHPLYESVASNLLSDSMRYMYAGSVQLTGRPEIDPYDIVHLFDPASSTFGPVEVDSVVHTFSLDGGFQTVFKPALVTHLRGVDGTSDIDWFQTASRYHSYLGFLSGVGRGLYASARSSVAIGAARSLGSGFLSSAATRLGVSSALGPYGWAAAIVYTGYEAIDLLANSAEDADRRFVGTMGQVLSANPVTFDPLTQDGRPLVAGLEGAVGPGSFQEMASTATDKESIAGFNQGLERIYDTLSQGSNL